MAANGASGLLVLLTVLAFGVAAAQGRHLRGRLPVVTKPTGTTTRESAVSMERRDSSALGTSLDLGTSLGKPLAVYTVPLSARVALTPLGMRSPGRDDESSALGLYDIQTEHKQLGYIKYSDAPDMVLKYFLVKATWTEAEAACETDGAALYTFDHSAQLDSAMANFYPHLLPWVDLQKPGVDGGSMVCAFLNGPAPGRSSLQWDDCHALHDFICQKPASTSKKFVPQSLRFPTHLTTITKLVTLSDFLTAFVRQSQTATSLLKPLINATVVQSPTLTLSQMSQFDSLMTQWQDFNFVTMPDIIALVTTTPTLSAAEIQQIQLATANGVSLFAETQNIMNQYSTELNLNPVQFPVIAFTRQAVSFYTAIASVVSTAHALLTISPSQATTLEGIVTHTQTLIDGAEIAFRATTTKVITLAPTLAQLLQTVIAPGQAAFTLLQPVIVAAAAAYSLTLTPTETVALQAAISQDQNFEFVLMPSIIAMLVANPVLSPPQLQQLADAVTQGVTVYTTIQDLSATIGPKLNLNPAILQALDSIGSQGIQLYNTLLVAVNDPSGQPTVSAAQLLQIQNMIAQKLLLINAAAASLTTTTTTTTPSTTTAVAPGPTLAQLLQATMTQYQAVFSLLKPIFSAAAANSLTLTPTEAAEIQVGILFVENHNNVLMPSIISMVEANPTLSPTQLQQLADAVSESLTISTVVQGIVAMIGPKLNIDPAILQALADMGSQGVPLFGALLVAVNDPSGQPTVSAAQLLQIQNMIAQAQSIANSAANFLTTTTSAATPTTTSSTTTPTPTPTTTTTTTTTPTTTTPTTTSTRRPTTTRSTTSPPTHPHGSSHTSLQLVLARMQGVLAELEALLPLLRSPSSTSGIRASSAQRQQSEDIVTKLLTLRARQTEIETRVCSMTAQEQEAIAGKLESAQRRLRKVVTDRSVFAQYLTVTSGKQPPIVALLNDTVDVLQPFF